MKTLWTIQKGCLVPTDETTVEFMRAAHFRVGDTVSCEITMLRSTVFFRAVHKLARLLIANTDTFHGKREHDVIKRLQTESGVWCDVVRADGVGMVDGKTGAVIESYLVFLPRSVAFDSMDEAEFRHGFDRIAEYVAEKYWPDFDLSLLDEED